MKQIARLAISGLSAADGGPLAPRLEALAARLREARSGLQAGGGVDPVWLRETIRDAATWVPDEGLPLLAALGKIARKARGPTQSR